MTKNMGLFSFSRKPPRQDQFARMVIDAVRRAGEKGKIIYDRERFRSRLEAMGSEEVTS